MMKLKIQQVFDATQTLATIIREQRALPTKGVYRVTRMHSKLLPEFTTINDQRTAKINSYEHKAWVTPQGAIIPAEEAIKLAGVSEQNIVPDDKMPEFIEWWRELTSGEEIEVNIDPIPIDQLCIEGRESSISAAEFQVLGDLVTEG